MGAPERPAARQSFALFAYGFRPFFTGAIAYAALSVGAWLWIRAAGVMPLPTLPPQYWHGHELLFGFIGAAIAGFLLTAVPSWTGAKGFSGARLIVLSGCWLAGRMAFALAQFLPAALIVVVELSFLPALIFALAPALLRTRNRNAALLAVLVVFWILDATFMLAMTRADPALAGKALYVGIDVVLLLITVIGGRIVPAFTANAMRARGAAAEPGGRHWLDVAAIAAMVFVAGIDAIAPAHVAAALAAGVAAAAQALRLSGWRGWRSWRDPIVWVLHLAYLWLPIGLALKATYLFSASSWSGQWLHALTIGAAATMVMAVITRASLGHTGRALVASPIVAVAYGLMSVAALVRVCATALMPFREAAIVASGALWVLAFLLVLIVYAPILLQSRVDGRPG
jgi:uncharacterized protein involved in response to NO